MGCSSSCVFLLPEWVLPPGVIMHTETIVNAGAGLQLVHLTQLPYQPMLPRTLFRPRSVFDTIGNPHHFSLISCSLSLLSLSCSPIFSRSLTPVSSSPLRISVSLFLTPPLSFLCIIKARLPKCACVVRVIRVIVIRVITLPLLTLSPAPLLRMNRLN